MKSQELLVDRVERDRTQMDGATITQSASEVRPKSDRRPKLSALQIPARVETVAELTPSSSLLPPLSASKSGKASAHGLLPRPGLRSRASFDKNVDTSHMSGAQRGPPESLPPTLSGPAQSPLSAKRTSSLPVRTNGESSGIGSNPIGGHTQESEVQVCCEPGYEKVGIVRSFSSPVNVNKVENLRRITSGGKGYVLLRSASPRAPSPQPFQGKGSVDATTPSNSARSSQLDVEKGKGTAKEEAEESIAEEEAVCRICMDSLTEEYGKTLKMECSCRGEMALAHQDCAFKWFGIKGNRVCDVCGSEAINIPVTVVRVPVETINVTRSMDTQGLSRGAVWQDVPVMGMISMLAYFCFLEQLLVGKMGTKALAVALPFSIIIGLLASVTTIALVSRRYIWLYASSQFGLVIFFGYVFFQKTQLEAVLAVLLAAFVGFGVAMTTNALILEYMHWKRYSAARRDLAGLTIMDQGSLQQDLSREFTASQRSRAESDTQSSAGLDREDVSINARSTLPSHSSLLTSSSRNQAAA